MILVGVARASARSAAAAPVGRSPQDAGEGSLNQQEGPSLEEPERQKPGFIHRCAGWCSMRMVRIPWLLRLMTRLHVLVYQSTGGRIGGRMAGVPVLLLHHVGRRSGRAFVAPLLCLEEAGELIVVRSPVEAVRPGLAGLRGLSPGHIPQDPHRRLEAPEGQHARPEPCLQWGHAWIGVGITPLVMTIHRPLQLQWGHAWIGVGMSTDWGGGYYKRHASMGPRLDRRGNTAADCAATSASSFNGATPG